MTTNNSHSIVEVDTRTLASSSASSSSASSSSSTDVPPNSSSSLLLWPYNGGCDEANLLPGQTCAPYDSGWLTELNLTNSSFPEAAWEEEEEGVWPGKGAAEGSPVEEGLSWRVLFLVLFVFVGITGNSLVCIAISVERKLQNVTNYFLMSLAVADLFVSLVVMPCCIVQEFMGYWPFDQVMCNIWQVSDVVMCTSSIMHMCTISMDRYTGIHDPLRSRYKSRSAVCVRIAAVWLTSMAIASPLVALGAIRPEQILSDARQCAIFNAYYLVYGSLASFFGPLLIMLVAFSLTVRLLNQQTRQLGLRRCKPAHRAGKGGQFEMRLIAPLGLTTAIAGNRLEVIKPPSPPSDEDEEDDDDDGHHRSRGKSRKKSLRWNVDGGQDAGPPRSALAELMATNLPSERDKSNERRKSMMQRTPGAVLKAMAMKYRSQAVDEGPVSRSGSPSAAQKHGRRTGGGGMKATSGSSYRRRSSGFLRLKHFVRDPLHLPKPKGLRDYDMELVSSESCSGAEASGANPFPDSISKDNGESSPLLRRGANSRRVHRHHSQVVILRLKPLRDYSTSSSEHRFSTSSTLDVADSVSGSSPTLSSLGTSESLKTLPPPRSGQARLTSASRVVESLESLAESYYPYEDGERLHASIGSVRAEDEKQPLFSVAESDNETDRHIHTHTKQSTQTPVRRPERYEERLAKTADRARVSPVRSSSEIFLRDLAKTRCLYRKSFCSRDELKDAGQLTRLLPSKATCSEDSDGLTPAASNRFDSAATVGESTDNFSRENRFLVGRRTAANPGYRSNGGSSSDHLNSRQSIAKSDMTDDEDQKVATPGGGDDKHRNSVNNSTAGEIRKSKDPSVITNVEQTTTTTTTTTTTVTTTTEDETTNSELMGSAAARGKFKNLVQKHGAAFQMAGMLMAKREESRKSEVNTVKTERKAIKVLGTMFALFCVSWTPFFSTNLAMGLCQSCHIDALLFKVFLWLGYASSTLNPIIYTVFNRAFRTTFIRIIKCGRQCVLPEFLRRWRPLVATEGKGKAGGEEGPAAEAEAADGGPGGTTTANGGALLERLRISKWMSKLTRETGESNL